MSLITNKGPPSTHLTLSSYSASVGSRSASILPVSISDKVRHSTDVDAIIKIWENHSKSFDLRDYAKAFTGINRLNGAGVLYARRTVDTVKKMVEKVVEHLNINEASAEFEKKDIQDIIHAISQVYIDDTADNQVKKLVEIFEDSALRRNALRDCTTARLCNMAQAWTDEPGTSHLLTQILAEEITDYASGTAANINPMIEAITKREVPERLHNTLGKLIDKATSRLDSFSANEIMRTLSLLTIPLITDNIKQDIPVLLKDKIEKLIDKIINRFDNFSSSEIAQTVSLLKKTNRLTHTQIEACSDKILQRNILPPTSPRALPLASYSASDLIALVRNFAELGLENSGFYGIIAEKLVDAKLPTHTEDLITLAWTLTMSGSAKVETVKERLQHMLTDIATEYDTRSKIPGTEYKFTTAQMTQLLWTKRGFEEAGIDFPEGELSDDIEKLAENGNGQASRISNTQQRVFDSLREVYWERSDPKRKPGERPYIEHEPKFFGLNPDMLIQHENHLEVVEVHGPTHYLDGRKCTRLDGKSKFKLRLLAKKAEGIANVIIIPTAEWDSLRTQSGRREYLQHLHLIPTAR